MNKSVNSSVNFLHLFGSNGWVWDSATSVHRNDGLDYYNATFLCEYHVYVTAVTSTHERGMELNGHLGVVWLEAEYECDMQHLSYGDLENMQGGMEMAEENLLKCGIPFCPDYKFHGKNVYRKVQMNNAIRKKLNLEQIEKELVES